MSTQAILDQAEVDALLNDLNVAGRPFQMTAEISEFIQ